MSKKCEREDGGRGRDRMESKIITKREKGGFREGKRRKREEERSSFDLEQIAKQAQ